jgi:hypothetical protein
VASIPSVQEPKSLSKRDLPLMYCGRCGSPLKQFGSLSRRRHAARCDYDRERNLAGLRDPEKRAKMFITLGESAVYVMATILGAKPDETVRGVKDHKSTGGRVRAVWFEPSANPIDPPPYIESSDITISEGR